MKLPDFRQNRELNALRQQMGADFLPWDSGEIPWKPFQKIVPFREIKITPGEPITHDGNTVIVYIRDQYIRNRHIQNHQVTDILAPDDLCKFHIAGCTTLQDMKRKRKYEDRYVVTNLRRGKFEVNFLEAFGKRLIEEGIECDLHVCRNCLRELDYQDYSTSHRERRNEIRNTFDREEFFEEYGVQINTLPKHSPKTAPLNVYTDDWDQVATVQKDEAGWKCEECHACFEHSDNRRFLHVHHIDGKKYNNASDNLRVLCIGCHAEIDPQLRLKPDYREYQNKAQGGTL